MPEENVPCKACGHFPTTRPWFNIPLCASCESFLQQGNVGSLEPSRARVENYVKKVSKFLESPGVIR